MNSLIGNFGEIILIEFSMIVDTDFGLIRFIGEKYANEDLFFTNIFELDNHLLKGVLMERTMDNPLQIIFKDESQTEMMNTFYKQFMERHYEEILKRSSMTSISILIKKLIDTEGTIKVGILCKNKMEKDFISHYMADCLHSLYSVILDTEDVFNVADYTGIMIKHASDLIRYKSLGGKTIYLAQMGFNYDNDLLENKKELFIKSDYKFIVTSSELKFITLYPYDNTYSINKDFESEKEDEIYVPEDEIDQGFISRVFGTPNGTLE